MDYNPWGKLKQLTTSMLLKEGNGRWYKHGNDFVSS